MTPMLKRLSFALLGCALSAWAGSALETLMPVPQQVEARDGGLALPATASASLPEAFSALRPEAERIFQEAGLPLAPAAPGTAAFVILRQGEVAGTKAAWQQAEAYRLEVDNAGIVITASAPAGAFHGLQTLRQLLPPKGANDSVPACRISDWPAFPVRGLLLDVGRNYQSLPQLKEQVDVLARYKYSVFHFHVTDNPGWRLESKRHPELQDPKAFGRRPDGIYTQAEFKELVAYCRERQITLIPEMDVPGHTEAFRRAFGLKSMGDPKVQGLVTDLLEELCTLATPEEMPYVHIGTDESKAHEKVPQEWLVGWAETLQKHGRQVIGWNPGLRFKTKGGVQVQQMWASAKPWPGVPYIDSQRNYINHVDPFELLPMCAYGQPCRHPGEKLGCILAVWHDNNVVSEKDVVLMNAVYPALLLYSDTAWRGRDKDAPELCFRLPARKTPEFALAVDLERRALAQRDRFFVGKPFPFLRQTDLEWRILGPFDHQGDFKKSFPPEQGAVQARYELGGKPYAWSEPVSGATVYLKHFWGWPGGPVTAKSGTAYAYTRIWSPTTQEVGAWIGFNAWSRSGRRGAPTPQPGQWSPCDARVWVNGGEIPGPAWKQPGVPNERTSLEIPFVDEDYHYRPPTRIRLNEGWNTVLLKIPFGGAAYKWVFTFIPVAEDAQGNFREVPGLRYSAELPGL